MADRVNLTPHGCSFSVITDVAIPMHMIIMRELAILSLPTGILADDRWRQSVPATSRHHVAICRHNTILAVVAMSILPNTLASVHQCQSLKARYIPGCTQIL